MYDKIEEELTSEGEHEELPLSENPKDVLDFAKSTTLLLIERAIPAKPKALTLKKAGECLQILGKIWNLSEYPPVSYAKEESCVNAEEKLMDREGYVDDYQYLHLEAVNMELTNVKIIPKYFVWLLSVDLSGNLLTNSSACPVTMLPNIVALRLNRNNFRDPYMPPMKHLQYLGLNSNKIKSLHRIYHPNLETLDLNYNSIKEVDARDCWKLTKLTQLELRGNRLQTTSGIEYATLVNLYLAQNKITTLQGMEILVNLERLHLRDNPLSDLTGFTSSNLKLKYLNIRECRIIEVEEIKNLSVLSGLRELIVKENYFDPEHRRNFEYGRIEEEGEGEEEEEEEEVEEEEEQLVSPQSKDELEEENNQIRIQILSYLPKLKRIDKKLVTKQELEIMRELMDDEDIQL